MRLTVKVTPEKSPHFLRRIVIWDEDNKRDIVILTNHTEFGSSTISSIIIRHNLNYLSDAETLLQINSILIGRE
jgi:hypothetical protein